MAAPPPRDRGGKVALSCPAPPSEPCRRICLWRSPPRYGPRTRLSSRWLAPCRGLAVSVTLASRRQKSPSPLKERFGQRRWPGPRPRPRPPRCFRSMDRRRILNHRRISPNSPGWTCLNYRHDGVHAPAVVPARFGFDGFAPSGRATRGARPCRRGLPLMRQASPFPGRLAAVASRTGFTFVWDRRSASGCSPPRLTTTQLPSAALPLLVSGRLGLSRVDFM